MDFEKNLALVFFCSLTLDEFRRVYEQDIGIEKRDGYTITFRGQASPDTGDGQWMQVFLSAGDWFFSPRYQLLFRITRDERIAIYLLPRQ